MNGENRRINFVNRQANRPVRLTICPTTGGQYQLSVSPFESVAGIKSTLARKLRLHAERMSLLYKDRLLLHGNLLDNQVNDGSHLTLVPNMETGTASQNTRSNCRVMQALENLSETQVNDFLTGRAPLLLAMKLGEHMMFVQLQLSTSSCSARRRSFLGANSAHTNNTGAPTQEKPKCACSPPSSPVPGTTPGAIIDSVNHLGQGVYSGSFSGTLDPSMQDTTGRPKRDVNTILQILNDLLLASPQLQQSTGYACRSRVEQNEYIHADNKTDIGKLFTPTDRHGNEDVLRGKVQTLQKMMQERKLRRQEKRGLRAPYQWTNRISSAHRRMSAKVKYESPLAMERDVSSKAENHAASDAFSTASASAMEHESVLV